MSNLKILKDHLDPLGEFQNAAILIGGPPEYYVKKPSISGVLDVIISKSDSYIDGTEDAINHFLKLFNIDEEKYKSILKIYTDIFIKYNIIKKVEKRENNRSYGDVPIIRKPTYIASFNEVFSREKKTSGFNADYIIDIKYIFHHIKVDELVLNIIISLPCTKSKRFYYKYEKSISGVEKHYISRIRTDQDKKNHPFKEFKLENIERVFTEYCIKYSYVEFLKKHGESVGYSQDLAGNDFNKLKNYFDLFAILEI